MGPGSLFTSLVPNLLVRDVARAIAASRAVRVFVCNLMTQANESLGLSASDHIRALYKHARRQLFDYALVNRTPASPELTKKYAEQGQSPIEADIAAIEALGVKPVLGEYLSEEVHPTEGIVARHNTRRVAEDLLRLMSQPHEQPVEALRP
jgi:uncharacterized cofD-like protein